MKIAALTMLWALTALTDVAYATSTTSVTTAAIGPSNASKEALAAFYYFRKLQDERRKAYDYARKNPKDLAAIESRGASFAARECSL